MGSEIRHGIHRLMQRQPAERCMFRMVRAGADIVIKRDDTLHRLAQHCGNAKRARRLAHQGMGHAIMARQDHHALIQRFVLGQRGAEPGFPAICGQQIGMEDRAIPESVFQQAVEGRTGGAGQMKKA